MHYVPKEREHQAPDTQIPSYERTSSTLRLNGGSGLAPTEIMRDPPREFERVSFQSMTPTSRLSMTVLRGTPFLDNDGSDTTL